jgi:hypothetical protein
MQLIFPPERMALSDFAKVPGPPTSTIWSTPRPPVMSVAALSQGLGARQFFVAGRRRDDLRAHHAGDLQREDRHAAGALHEDGLPGHQLAVLDEGVPGGQGGAGQGRRFLKAHVGGNRHDALLLEHDDLGEHAVDAAAERAGLGVGAWLAADPVLEEAARDAIADLDAGDVRADRDDLARAVRQGNHVGLRRRAVAAERDGEIAEIQ